MSGRVYRYRPHHGKPTAVARTICYVTALACGLLVAVAVVSYLLVVPFLPTDVAPLVAANTQVLTQIVALLFIVFVTMATAGLYFSVRYQTICKNAWKFEKLRDRIGSLKGLDKVDDILEHDGTVIKKVGQTGYMLWYTYASHATWFRPSKAVSEVVYVNESIVFSRYGDPFYYAPAALDVLTRTYAPKTLAYA